MIDYLCIFANQSAAKSDAAVGAFWNGSAWDTSTVFLGVTVSTTATIVNGVSTSGAFWIVVSRTAAVSALDAICAMKLDRNLGIVHGSFVLASTVTGSDRTGLSFSPAPHGSKYPTPLGDALPISFGAIRWDAWYGNNAAYSSFQTAATFSDVTPVDWRSRAPAHANLATSPITWADNQTTFDNEINIAANGGIDYWVYLKYAAPDAGNQNAGLAYHLASSIKAKVKFALMRQTNDFGSTGNYTSQINDTVTYMQDSAYMTIGGRPVLYIYFNAGDIVSFWGGVSSNFAAMIRDLRAAVQTAGMQNPLIITVGPGAPTSTIATYGVDAVSNYVGPGPGIAGAPYSALDTALQNYWASLMASSIVPICMVGWDPRPRRQHPENFANGSGTDWVITPTVNELTSHLVAARNYIINNPTRCAALTALVYSWSEYDEGGVMPAPTVGDPTGSLSQAFGAAKVLI